MHISDIILELEKIRINLYDITDEVIFHNTNETSQAVGESIEDKLILESAKLNSLIIKIKNDEVH